MNDQAYPRPTKTLGFDLITKKPKRGDRSRRQNDRYLFLEALLSSRKYFYLSYVGHNIHDNTVMPPSVLVSELLDYINKGFTSIEPIVTHHPLQAFSPRYFNGSDKNLFSFSNEYCTASSILLKERCKEAKTFILNPLPEPQPIAEWKTIDIKYLTNFFINPTEFLLNKRLGIILQNKEDLIDENEPFKVEGLDRYQLNQTLVEKSLEGGNLQEYQAFAKADGCLPHGDIGDYVYDKMIKDIQPFVKRVKDIIQDEKMASIAVNKTIGDMHITGRLGRLWQNNMVHYRFAKLKSKDHIKLWIHHLILNSLDEKIPRHSILIGEDKSWKYHPVSNSEEILDMLLNDFYWQGLQEPLRFFPRTSLTFVEHLK